MLLEMLKCPSPSSSASLASSLKPVPPLPAGALTQIWPPAARAWWMYPSGAEETATTGWLMEREGRELRRPPHLKARSLETSKSQTLEGITRGNRWVWAIQPGQDALCVVKANTWFAAADGKISHLYMFCKSPRRLQIINPNYLCLCHRKSPLYDNCFLHAPDDQPLCTCDKKKAKWYLDKGIGGTLPKLLSPPIKCEILHTN